jgi:hypothetical protein
MVSHYGASLRSLSAVGPTQLYNDLDIDMGTWAGHGQASDGVTTPYTPTWSYDSSMAASVITFACALTSTPTPTPTPTSTPTHYDFYTDTNSDSQCYANINGYTHADSDT